MLSDAHDQAVHLVVDLRQGGARRRAHGRGKVSGAGKPGLEARRSFRMVLLLLANRGKRALKQFPYLLIVRSSRHDLMPLQHSSRVGIDHEDRMISRVKENRIGGFRSNAV